jgi:hypothetical protein
MAKIESDTQFWTAIDRTNKELESSGLYLSHLFTDRQIALTSDWLEKIVPIPSGGFRYLQLFRPSSTDLILTKMMRNDREDLDDIRFILGHERISPLSLNAAFQDVTRLEIPELRDIFNKMQPVVSGIANSAEKARDKMNMPRTSNYTLDPDWWEKLTSRQFPGKSLEPDREIEP